MTRAIVALIAGSLSLPLLDACGRTWVYPNSSDAGSRGAAIGSTGSSPSGSQPGPADGGCCGAQSCCRTPPVNHRPTAVVCPATNDGGMICPSGPPRDPDGGCAPPLRSCTDDCLADTDCRPGFVCSCASDTNAGIGGCPVNTCIPASCETDADCGTGGFCSPSVSFEKGTFYGIQSYECHGCADCCVNDSDCGAAKPPRYVQPYCAYSPEVGHWACGDAHFAG